jgi:hypothetical protein
VIVAVDGPHDAVDPGFDVEVVDATGRQMFTERGSCNLLYFDRIAEWPQRVRKFQQEKFAHFLCSSSEYDPIHRAVYES